MKVKRMIKSDVDTFKVGDIIKVKLTDGVKVQAMAMQQEEDGMIFCLVDCLPGEYPMNSTRTNEGGYEESDLRKKLNGEILNRFPVELTDMMAPFDNGDLLRLPTEKEIFGENYYGEYESPYVKQWKPMKKRRTVWRRGTKDENLQWYWLMNKVREPLLTSPLSAATVMRATATLLTLMAFAPLSKSRIVNLHLLVRCQWEQKPMKQVNKTMGNHFE